MAEQGTHKPLVGGSNPPSATTSHVRALGVLARALADGADRDQLIPDGVPLVIAISGGADSSALLLAASQLAPGRRWRLVAAHVDHMLRPSSGHDSAVARALAERLSVPFHERRVDVASLARTAGASLEAAGREARYSFFEEIADALGEDGLIATGHTADDSAETVLLNLARGSGVAGLRGIPVRRGRVVRPLLGARRAELRRALIATDVPFVDDESNSDPRFARNRVRAEVMPALERLNPAVVEALLRLATLAGDDDDLLTATALRELERRRLPGEAIRLDWRDPPARPIGRRVVRIAVHSAPSLERVEALLDVAEGGQGGKRVELGRGLAAVVAGRTISFTRAND